MEIKKFPEINDNENMTTQNLWDAAKAVILLQETRKHRTDSLSLHLKQLEKEQKHPQN